MLWLEPHCLTPEVPQTSSKAVSGINILYLLTGPIGCTRCWIRSRPRFTSAGAVIQTVTLLQDWIANQLQPPAAGNMAHFITTVLGTDKITESVWSSFLWITLTLQRRLVKETCRISSSEESKQWRWHNTTSTKSRRKMTSDCSDKLKLLKHYCHWQTTHNLTS